jgi:trimeric autotransporter adhesin
VSVALSADGDTLAVGAYLEDSFAFGIDGDQNNDFVENAGAAYVFERNAMEQWSQQAYVKASNTGWGHTFGWSVALSSDGDTLAVGAYNEGSNATGIGGDEWNELASYSGAVYVFERNAMSQWSQQAYVKASNTNAGDAFGHKLALSAEGDVLAVGAYNEDSNATGIDGNQASQAALDAGAVYVFERDLMDQWSQQAYVKASNTGAGDYFGDALALSGNGNVLVIGAYYEASNAVGIEGNQADNSLAGAGATYVTVRDGAGEWSTPTYLKAPNTDGGGLLRL